MKMSEQKNLAHAGDERMRADIQKARATIKALEDELGDSLEGEIRTLAAELEWLRQEREAALAQIRTLKAELLAEKEKNRGN